MKQTKKPFGPLYQEAVIAYARDEIGLNFGTVSVLRALVSFTNGETGQARPGVNKIIKRAGCSEKTVERALKALRDTQVIRPLAYAKGGRGCATVYGFALPAWSGQPRKETTDNLSGESLDGENRNHRQFVPKPPTICPKTTDNLSVPTERTERTEEKASAGRRQEAPARAKTPEEQAQFSQLQREYSYSYALSWWKGLLKNEIPEAE